MLKNGRNAYTGNSRRYFFVKDRIDKGEIRVEYCLIEIMLADFLQNLCKDSYLKNLEM